MSEVDIENNAKENIQEGYSYGTEAVQEKESSGRKRFELDMTTGPLMPKLITFFVPLMFSNILQMLFNAVDLVVVGEICGKTPLAAVGATTALINVFINFFIGLSLGANVLAARFYATKEKDRMSTTVHTSVSMALISGVLMVFVGLLFSEPALRLMGTPDDVIDMSVLYMRIYFCGMPFFMLYNYGAAILRAVGDTTRPLIFLVIAGVLNASLNIALITLFDMGVAGVAIATVVSQMVSCILVVICLMKSDSAYKLRWNKLCIDPDIIKKIFVIGVPAGIQSTVINLSNALLQSSVNSFGSDAMAGYTAANSLLGFLYVSVNSITQACMNFTSQNYGVHNMKRVDQVLKNCIILETVVGLGLGSIMYIFGSQFISIYNSAPPVVAAGLEIVAVTTLPYFLCGYMDCLTGALRGLGNSTVPMILSIIGTVGMRIVWIYLLFPSHRSIFFLFISYPASWTFTIMMQLVCWVITRKGAEVMAA